MKDKDWQSMLRELQPVARLLVGVRASMERALPSSELAQEGLRTGMDAIDGQDVPSGVRLALERAGSRDVVLIAGSHYVAGEAISHLAAGGRAT